MSERLKIITTRGHIDASYQRVDEYIKWFFTLEQGQIKLFERNDTGINYSTYR